jgi:hypothetical protein
MPEKPYDHKEIELKWHDRWKDDSAIYAPEQRLIEAEVLRR